MITWLVPRQDLTPDQMRVVQLPPVTNRLVVGMAGSGKTQVLVHRAAHLAETLNTPPNRYRIFVFTNVIKEYIRSGLEYLNLPDISVSTFDYWTMDLFERYLGSRLPRRPSDHGIDFSAIRHRALDIVRANRNLQNLFDFVLVDEGQDLTPEAYEAIQLAARHVTVFADPLQKIFEEGAEAESIAGCLHITAPQISVLGAYRNAVFVAQLAAHFIDDPVKRSQFLARISAAQRVREKPLCFVARTFDEELDRLAEVIRTRQVKNERIGIIVPTNRLLHGIAQGLTGRGVAVEKATTKEEAGKSRVICSFDNLTPKIATFHMAKGLTFDSVFLPRLTDKAYSWTRPEQLKRMMFVGVARATQWAYLSTVEGQEFDEMKTLREAASEGHLEVKRGGESARIDSGGRGMAKKRPEDEFPVL